MMTHDELLDSVQEAFGVDRSYELFKALRAVVELHKPKFWQNPNVPEWNGANCTHCLEERGDYMSPIEASYPCPTIQAIMEQLK